MSEAIDAKETVTKALGILNRNPEAHPELIAMLISPSGFIAGEPNMDTFQTALAIIETVEQAALNARNHMREITASGPLLNATQKTFEETATYAEAMTIKMSQRMKVQGQSGQGRF